MLGLGALLGFVVQDLLIIASFGRLPVIHVASLFYLLRLSDLLLDGIARHCEQGTGWERESTSNRGKRSCHRRDRLRPGDRESFLYYLAVEAPLRANVKDGRAGESERSPNYTSKCVCPHHASPPEYFFGVIRTIDRWQELLDPRILNSQSSVMISGNWKDGDSGLLDVLNDMGYLG
jgi:hypothetical protein